MIYLLGWVERENKLLSVLFIKSWQTGKQGGLSTPGDEYTYPISGVKTLTAISSALFRFAMETAYSAALRFF
jgi:hypothetical protein